VWHGKPEESFCRGGSDLFAEIDEEESRIRNIKPERRLEKLKEYGENDLLRRKRPAPNEERGWKMKRRWALGEMGS